MINEVAVVAQAAKCPACPAWVINHGVHSRKIREQTLLVKCPVDSCGHEFEVNYGETKMCQVPESWIKRGYFYVGELRNL